MISAFGFYMYAYMLCFFLYLHVHKFQRGERILNLEVQKRDGLGGILFYFIFFWLANFKGFFF